MVDAVGIYLAWAVFDNLHAIRIIRIGDCHCIGFQMIEEFLLGLEVVFHRAMVIEMIVGQVGKDADIEVNGVHSALLNADGRSFQGTGLDPGTDHVMENAMQIINIRCRQ